MTGEQYHGITRRNVLVPHLVLRQSNADLDEVEFRSFQQFARDAIDAHRYDTNWPYDLRTIDEYVLRSPNSRYGVS